MGRAQVQPSISSNILSGSYGKADNAMKRQDASKMRWRTFGMRVLLLAVTAAVMGTLLLEHMRLKALTAPQHLTQPIRHEHIHQSSTSTIDNPSLQQQQQHQQQQQQQVPSSAGDFLPGHHQPQQQLSSSAGVQQQLESPQEEALPLNR
jgi:hypothetical protein